MDRVDHANSVKLRRQHSKWHKWFAKIGRLPLNFPIVLNFGLILTLMAVRHKESLTVVRLVFHRIEHLYLVELGSVLVKEAYIVQEHFLRAEFLTCAAQVSETLMVLLLEFGDELPASQANRLSLC